MTEFKKNLNSVLITSFNHLTTVTGRCAFVPAGGSRTGDVELNATEEGHKRPRRTPESFFFLAYSFISKSFNGAFSVQSENSQNSLYLHKCFLELTIVIRIFIFCKLCHPPSPLFCHQAFSKGTAHRRWGRQHGGLLASGSSRNFIWPQTI